MRQMIIDNLGAFFYTIEHAFDQLVELITFDPQTTLGSYWSKFVEYFGILQSIAVGLTVIFFYIGIVKKAVRLEELKQPSAAVGLFLQFALAVMFVRNSLNLALYVYQFGRSLILKLHNATDFGQIYDITSEAADKIKKTDTTTAVFMIVVTMLMLGLSLLIQYYLFLILYGRMFRVYSYIIMSPFAFAMLASDATSTNASHYFKNFFALILEGVLMVVSSFLYIAILNSQHIGTELTANKVTMSEMMLFCGNICFWSILLVTVIKTAEREIKEMFGLFF